MGIPLKMHVSVILRGRFITISAIMWCLWVIAITYSLDSNYPMMGLLILHLKMDYIPEQEYVQPLYRVLL